MQNNAGQLCNRYRVLWSTSQSMLQLTHRCFMTMRARLWEILQHSCQQTSSQHPMLCGQWLDLVEIQMDLLRTVATILALPYSKFPALTREKGPNHEKQPRTYSLAESSNQRTVRILLIIQCILTWIFCLFLCLKSGNPNF